MEIKNFVSIKEAAELSGLPVYFWRHAVANGTVYFIKSGSKYYIDYNRSLERLRCEKNNPA